MSKDHNRFNVSKLGNALKNINANIKSNATALNNFSSMMNAITTIQRKPAPNPIRALNKTAKAVRRKMLESKKVLEDFKKMQRKFNITTRRNLTRKNLTRRNLSKKKPVV